ncbi:PTS mannose transporter subunit IIC [Lacticaseibacillus paracasei subsp. tolerans]|nr:PTS mannose/fructose/sorbose transporter subunit IIB [Lacticaseibacillus paracasei]GEL37678.1 PTS mannose transporter subunit IIC [Lacticaseibacillus paracasei subsp. tolerans]
MTVVLARVDQRLVHGIVVNQWAAEVQPKRYMVIDDAVSQDEDVKASMRLSKPAGTGMSIIDTEKALTNFKAGKYDAQRVFVIAKEPSTMLKLLDAGIEIPRVDIGIIFAEDGRTQISKFVSVNQQEVADFKELEKHGVPVNICYVPADSPEPFDKAIAGKDIK